MKAPELLKSNEAKNWVVLYLVLFIIIAIVSGIFENYSVNIHGAYIFMISLLIGLGISLYNSINSFMKYFLACFITILIVDLTTLEFYHRLPYMDILLQISIGLCLVWFVVGKIINRRKKK